MGNTNSLITYDEYNKLNNHYYLYDDGYYILSIIMIIDNIKLNFKKLIKNKKLIFKSLNTIYEEEEYDYDDEFNYNFVLFMEKNKYIPLIKINEKLEKMI